MGKSRLKKCFIILGIIMALIILYFVIAFLWNPVSRLLCKHSAEKYVEQNYPGYIVEKSGYNFKDGNYYAHIDQPDQLDAQFYIYMDWLGNVTYDNFDFYVASKHNTYNRIYMEYRDLVRDALENTKYNLTLIGGDIYHIGNYELEFGSISNPDKVFMPDEEVVAEKLFNYEDLGKDYGAVLVWAEEADVSYENAARIVLDLKESLDKAGVKFYYMDFYLRPPRNEDGTVNVEGIQFEGFRYTDIYAEGLEERIKAAKEQRTRFYEEMDKQREKETSIQ